MKASEARAITEKVKESRLLKTKEEIQKKRKELLVSIHEAIEEFAKMGRFKLSYSGEFHTVHQKKMKPAYTLVSEDLRNEGYEVYCHDYDTEIVLIIKW